MHNFRVKVQPISAHEIGRNEQTVRIEEKMDKVFCWITPTLMLLAPVQQTQNNRVIGGVLKVLCPDLQPDDVVYEDSFFFHLYQVEVKEA